MKRGSDRNDLVPLAINAFAIAAFSAFSLAQSPMNSSPTKPKYDPGAPQESSESLAAADKIRVIDTDGDGILTAEEYTAGARRLFNEQDTHKDGDLTLAEIRAGHEKYRVGGDTN